MPSGFRPDIQALRALAVSAVLLYHFWPGLVPGGYVGVDVFFVVSGFLITGLLVRELEETGRVDLLAFYAGRVRRLLPAALLVLGVSLAVLVVFMPPVVWRSNVAEIAAAAVYALNWALGLQQVDYFTESGGPSLVQHYWSLSLEEQFYLVWPIVLLLAVGIGALARWGTVRRRALGAVTAIGLLSLVTCLSLPSGSGAAFFSTQARAWEFALGGLVALAPATRIGLRTSRVLVAAGVAAVVWSCLTMSGSSAFPGWLTLVPTTGAALVIAADVGARGGGGLMGWAPLQWVGDHSYSLYLWHWPPLVALPWVLHGELGNGVRVGILAATVLLAWVTKALVEDPARTPWPRRARWPSLVLAATGMCVLLAGTTAVNATVGELEQRASASAADRVASNKSCFGASALVDAGCRRPFARPGVAKVAFASRDDDPALRGCQLDVGHPTEPLWCEWSTTEHPTTTIAVVGNSFAGQLATTVRQWAADRPIRILLAARTGCLGLSGRPVSGQPADDPCPIWSGKVLSRLLAMDDLSAVVFSDHPDAAVFMTGQTRPGPRALAQAEAGVLRTLRSLRRAGVATAVVEGPPGHPTGSAPECIAISTARYDPCGVPREQLAPRSLLIRTAAGHPALTKVIPLTRYLCDKTTCHVTVGGVVVYKDEQHLTGTFARTLARPLAPALRSLLGEVRERPSPHGS